MKSKLLFTLMAGLFASGAAFAQTSQAPQAAQPSAPAASAPTQQGAPDDRAAAMQRHFSKLDKNGDGMISKEEAQGHRHLSKNFDQIDTTRDSQLSKEELQAFHAGMREKQRARFDESFKAADKNNDGLLTKAEVVDSKLPGLAKHFDSLDANKDGSLSKEEIQAARANMHRDHQARHGEHMARLAESFKAADKDGDGALTKAEAEAGKVGRLAKNFDRFDANKDGKVTQEEIKSVMDKHHAEHGGHHGKRHGDQGGAPKQPS